MMAKQENTNVKLCPDLEHRDQGVYATRFGLEECLSLIILETILCMSKVLPVHGSVIPARDGRHPTTTDRSKSHRQNKNVRPCLNLKTHTCTVTIKHIRQK